MIRKADINDAINIAKIDSEIFTDSLGLEFIESDLRFNPFANYFVYEIDNIIVGYIIAWISDNTSILNFGVLNEYRKQGIGNILFDEVEKNTEGVMTLEVRVSNTNAINFYEKRGFLKHAIRKNYYSNGEDAILMVR